MNIQQRQAIAIGCARLLNEFVGDLVAGTQLFTIIETKWSKRSIDVKLIGLAKRICLSHLIICLCKLMEFHNTFKGIIPHSCKAEFKSLSNTLRDRKLRRDQSDQKDGGEMAGVHCPCPGLPFAEAQSQIDLQIATATIDYDSAP